MRRRYLLTISAIGALESAACTVPVEDGSSGAPPGAGGGVSSSGGEGEDEGAAGSENAFVLPLDTAGALVDKGPIFTTYRRTSDGITSLDPQNTHVCVLSDVQGNMHLENVHILNGFPMVDPSGATWILRAMRGLNVGAICYRHSNFTARPGSITMWAGSTGSAWVSTAWPDCLGRKTMNSWHGDAVTYLAGVDGWFQGTGELAMINQSPSFSVGQSSMLVRTGLCFGITAGWFQPYFVGIPGVTFPIFIGANDVRSASNGAGAEFTASAGNGTTQTVQMARTDRAMCYLTRFSGDFNGDGERGRIFSSTVDGVQRWHLQCKAGSGASCLVNARCLAFDQATTMPGPD